MERRGATPAEPRLEQTVNYWCQKPQVSPDEDLRSKHHILRRLYYFSDVRLIKCGLCLGELQCVHHVVAAALSSRGWQH